MKISNLIWDENNVEHIALHEVIPKEVEEVCYSNHLLVLRVGRKKQKKRLYYILGQTVAGRHLFIVCRYIGKGQAKAITAREMDNSERALFKKRGK